jgi:hypothetical protein
MYFIQGMYCNMFHDRRGSKIYKSEVDAVPLIRRIAYNRGLRIDWAGRWDFPLFFLFLSLVLLGWNYSDGT